MLLMKERIFLYELRAYLIYVKVGERSFLYELSAYLLYLKVGENNMRTVCKNNYVYLITLSSNNWFITGMSFLWIFSIFKRRRITHKLNKGFM